MQSFQLVGLDPALFESMFEFSDTKLAELGAIRQTATASSGFPCRVSLEDAKAGEELLLLSFAHQPADSPYRASGAMYVRRGAQSRNLPFGEIPEYVSRRLMSVRGYDRNHMMVEAEVCEGAVAENEIKRQFSKAHVSYIHLHIARRGCFACRVDRA